VSCGWRVVVIVEDLGFDARITGDVEAEAVAAVDEVQHTADGLIGRV
jgi:hypothetical protein